MSLILETVCTSRKTIRIAGDDYPAELVKAKFMKLNSSHIEFVFACMSENTTKIRNMIRLTVEEMNLLSIYHEGSKAQLMENMTAALPFMDEDMRPFAERTLQKISPLTENEYAELAIFAADEV